MRGDRSHRRDRRERGGGIQNARGESRRETDKNPRPRHHAGGRGRRAAAAGGAGDSRRQGGEPPDRPPRKRRTQRAGRGAQRTRAPQAQGTAPGSTQPPGRVRRARECAAEAPSTAQAQGPGATCRTRAGRRISLSPNRAERQKPRLARARIPAHSRG